MKNSASFCFDCDNEVYEIIREYEEQEVVKKRNDRESAKECRRCNESGDCFICILGL